jgi:hypothetical protein
MPPPSASTDKGERTAGAKAMTPASDDSTGDEAIDKAIAIGVMFWITLWLGAIGYLVTGGGQE